MDDKITIISGPNGYGKTTVLKLLDSFFKCKFTDIKNIPFKSFRLEFDNGKLVNVYKNYFFLASQSLVDNSYDCILLKKPFPDKQDDCSYESDLVTDNRIFIEYKSEASNEREIFAYDFYGYEKIEFNSLNSSSNEISKIKDILEQKNKDKAALNELLNEVFLADIPYISDSPDIIMSDSVDSEHTKNLKNYLEYVGYLNESKPSYGINIVRQPTIFDLYKGRCRRNNLGTPYFLTEIREAIYPQLIESQRLHYYDDNKDNTKSRRTEHTHYRYNNEQRYDYSVNRCSEEIKDEMSRCYKFYSLTSQKLDKTFPIRLMNATVLEDNKKIEVSSIISGFEYIDELQVQLSHLGLYSSDINSINSIPQISEYNLRPETLLALKLYIDDNKEKLSTFSDLQNKMQIFEDIIEKLFFDKYIMFSQDKGFYFIDLYTGIELTPEQLSSGEQHIVVLFFDLLFRAKRGSLVLIDEPEISLHVAWQRKFIEILNDIIKVVDMDIIVSTHSPSIIHNRMDLTVLLGGVHK